MFTSTRNAVVAGTMMVLLASLPGRAVRGQISTDEAQRRLALKQQAGRAPATQPSGELERLRAENRRLRVHVLSLEEEIQTLKLALAQADKAAPCAATRPAADAVPQSPIVGRWRGGDINAGAGYIINFSANGSYQQSFIAYDQHDSGHYKADGGILEMWSSKTPEDRKHNQYRMTVANGQVTLTPVVVEGVEVKHGKPLVLRKAE